MSEKEYTNPSDKDRETYDRLRRLAEVARQDVERRVRAALDELGDPILIRAVSAPPRVKSFSSLIRKAHAKGWSISDCFKNAQDFVGCRLVCNNLQDALRGADLVQSSLERDGFHVKRTNFISRPSGDGYRAIHLIFRFRVRMGEDEANLGCEIQIRSLLQDAWAQLSRADIYGTTVPLQVRNRMAHLSSLLARADAEADSIRRELARPRKGRKPQPGAPLTPSSIAFLYKRTFGEDPEEYLVQSVLREFGGFQVRSDGLAAVLADTDYMGRLKAAYERRTRWEVSNGQQFRWAVLSMVQGAQAGIRRAEHEGKRDWQEIEATARAEMMSILPETIEDLLDELRSPPKDGDPCYDIEQWASALGAVRTCGCGQTIVDAEMFAQKSVSHYKLRGQRADRIREELETETMTSGVETGGWGNSSICSHCDYILSKDD